MAIPQQEHELTLVSVGRGPGKFRCCCLQCGSHVVAQGGFQPAGQCANCGSYDLGPLGTFQRRTTRAESSNS
jgi:hypothetical protein